MELLGTGGVPPLFRIALMSGWPAWAEPTPAIDIR
jgi:hypothetical protein